MYLFKEYARTATIEAESYRNINESIFFSKPFLLVITRYGSHLCVPRVGTQRIIIAELRRPEGPREQSHIRIEIGETKDDHA